ncbi:MAG: helix-turn-helix domain-containing protein [Deferribacteraceae bacterium]|jgi:DNA-binding transcriptional regulator YiaG|nr:helix-turn-helix domain-containing protein [Deferribacteraceae bacterium]
MSKNLSKVKQSTKPANSATEGKRLKYVRELLKLSLTDFARPLGKHLSAVQKWEASDRKLDKSNLLLLEKIWSINPDFIQSGSGDPFLQTDADPTSWLVYDIIGKSYADYLNLRELTPIDTLSHELSKHLTSLLFIRVNTNKVPGIIKDDIVGIKLDGEAFNQSNTAEGHYLAVIDDRIVLTYLCFLDGNIILAENYLRSDIKLKLTLIKPEQISILGRIATLRRP